MTTADSIACDHRYHRFWQILNGFLQVKRVQARHAIVADIPTMTAHTLIPARAERLITRTGKNSHANFRVLATDIEGINQFRQRFGPEGIAHLGPIDGNLSHTLGFFKNDVCIVTDLLPMY